MQHRGEDHSKTNGNQIYLCHSWSDLHLNRENGKKHDLGMNHDYDKTSNLGHVSHTNLNVRKRVAHKTIGLIRCNRSRPNRRWAQHTSFFNQTSPLQNFQSCHSCVAQNGSACLHTRSPSLGHRCHRNNTEQLEPQQPTNSSI